MRGCNVYDARELQVLTSRRKEEICESSLTLWLNWDGSVTNFHWSCAASDRSLLQEMALKETNGRSLLSHRATSLRRSFQTRTSTEAPEILHMVSSLCTHSWDLMIACHNVLFLTRGALRAQQSWMRVSIKAIELGGVLCFQKAQLTPILELCFEWKQLSLDFHPVTGRLWAFCKFLTF